MNPPTIWIGAGCRPVLSRIEAVRHPFREERQLAVQVVRPCVVRTPEQRRVAFVRQLDDRDRRVDRLGVLAGFRRSLAVALAHPRSAVAADVVERLDLACLVAQDDDALTATELGQEEVAGLRDAADVVVHEPEVVGEEALVVRVDLVVGVVLDGNRRALFPAGGILRRRLAGRSERVLKHQVAAVAPVVHAPVADFGRHGDLPPFGHGHAGRFGHSGDRRNHRCCCRSLAKENSRQRGCCAGGPYGYRCPCEVTSADLLAHSVLHCRPDGCL